VIGCHHLRPKWRKLCRVGHNLSHIFTAWNTPTVAAHSFCTYIIITDVPNSGFRLFGRIRIRIALAAEHFDAAPAVLIFTTSLCPSLITAVPACCLAMTLSPSFVSNNQAVGARTVGTDWVKSVVDVSSSALYMYRLTIRIRSDDIIRPNTNTLFGPIFGIKADIRCIPNYHPTKTCSRRIFSQVHTLLSNRF